MSWKGMAAVVIALLMGSSCYAGSGIISEDVAYWWLDASSGQVETMFTTDPGFTQQWLDEHLDALLIKVQQTVYSQTVTEQILTGNGNTAIPGGYLYAYSVTNLGWTDAIATGGIEAFSVNWGSAPLLATTSYSQTPSGWVSILTGSGPEWQWSPSTASPGIPLGGTVGGFWAVAATGDDTVVDATAASIDGAEVASLGGKTTGPSIPEPGGVVAIAIGMIGLIGRRRRAR